MLAVALLTLSLVLNTAASSSSYVLQNFYAGYDFEDWTWETFDDPTHGRVNYVNQSTAKERNLYYATKDQFFMGADSTNLVPPAARGRDSIRIVSKETCDECILILDLGHMPTGCTTWPAFWTLSKDGPWPQGGEIDIIEGVHNATNNLGSLHTTPDCSVPQDRGQTGQTVSTDCDASHNYNQGCGTLFKETTSFGNGFNDAQGGWYAMEKAEDSINIWFWSRDDTRVPSEVKVACGDEGQPPISTTWWGVPNAKFPMNTCGYDTHFNAHSIVFDLTFCGDWAGNDDVWATSGCANATYPTCESYVNNNFRAFEEAYWEINSLRIYNKL